MFARTLGLIAIASASFSGPALAAPPLAVSAVAPSAACAGPAPAQIAFPAGEEALRAEAGSTHAPHAPYVRLFLWDGDGSALSVIAEPAGSGWMLYTANRSSAEERVTYKARSVRLDQRRAGRLTQILADACFWTEASDPPPAAGDVPCSDNVDFYLDVDTPQGRRTSHQHCSAHGLLGEAANLLRNGAELD